MSRDHSKLVKGFTIHTQCWWAQSVGDRPSPNRLPQDVVEEIMVGFYGATEADGGTSGEFAFVWEKIGDQTYIRLKAFSDGWSALVNMPELLMLMAEIDDDAGSNRSDMSPEEFANELKAIGFIDRTKRTYKSKEDDEAA